MYHIISKPVAYILLFALICMAPTTISTSANKNPQPEPIKVDSQYVYLEKAILLNERLQEMAIDSSFKVNLKLNMKYLKDIKDSVR